MIDIDHFKRFNDTFGHEAGDAVLTEVARVLQKQTRGSDVASRMGGEELVVVLPGASLVDAERRAEHLRVSIAALNLHHRGQSLGHLTISIGVATTETDGVAADLIHAADQAMYRAKREGRDCVRVAGEPRETRDIREPPRTFGSAVNVSMVAA